MAIEALNSAVSYQAQTTRQAKPVQKTVVEDTEVTTTQGKAVSGDVAAGTRELRPIIRVLPNSRQQVMNRSGRLSNSSIRTCPIPKQYSEFMRQRTVLRSRL